MVAVLELAADALQASQQQLAAVAAAAAAAGGTPSAGPVDALAAVRDALAGPGATDAASGGGELLLPALRARLAQWQQLVRSHQGPTRLRQWAAPGPAATP